MITNLLITLAMRPTDYEFLFGREPESGLLDWLSPMITGLLVSALGAGVLAGVIIMLRRRDRARHGPLVRHLARHLGLTTSDRLLLRRVSQSAGISSPASLLLSRGCFDHAVATYVHRGEEAQRLYEIRTSVFN